MRPDWKLPRRLIAIARRLEGRRPPGSVPREPGSPAGPRGRRPAASRTTSADATALAARLGDDISFIAAAQAEAYRRLPRRRLRPDARRRDLPPQRVVASAMSSSRSACISPAPEWAPSCSASTLRPSMALIEALRASLVSRRSSRTGATDGDTRQQRRDGGQGTARRGTPGRVRDAAASYRRPD